MKAIIDNEACIGCGLCAQVAPDVYKMEGDKAVSVSDDISDELKEQAEGGSEQCPVNAISVS